MNKKWILPVAGVMLFASAFSISSPKQSAVAEKKSYTQVAATHNLGSGLKKEPDVVFKVDSQADLTAIEGAAKKPTVALIEVNSSMEAVLGSTSLSFTTLFDSYLKGTVIPALRIETTAVADAFIAYMTGTYYIEDIMVVSKSTEVLGKIYANSVTYVVNGVYDVSDKTLPDNRYDFFDYLGEANKVGSNIVIINAEDKNAGVIAPYAAAVNKMCWGAVSDSRTKVVGAVAAGCLGVVGDGLGNLQDGVKAFAKNGFAVAQSVAAHRGITAYANENSLTACAAAANEGATHIEVDVQATSDGEIILCHNTNTSFTARGPGDVWIPNVTLETLRGYTLSNYDSSYAETFPTLQELVEVMLDTDVIFIIELKLDGANPGVLERKPIEKIYEILSSYPEMKGRWFTITFYGTYAKKMKEVCPEIPVGCLGFANDGTGENNWTGHPASEALTGNYSSFLKFNRSLNVGLEYSFSGSRYTAINQYLVRGYLQNSWTYEDLSHYSYGVNIATTNKAEQSAMLVNEIGLGKLEFTKEQIESGALKVACRTYNGFVREQFCDVVYLDGTVESGNTVYAVLYTSNEYYGLYSELLAIKVK